MSDYDRSILAKVHGRQKGCPEPYDEQPALPDGERKPGWVCTDHFHYGGEVLHVAANSEQVVGAWFDGERNWARDYPLQRDPIFTLVDLEAVLLEHGVLRGPNEAEVQATAERLQLMLKEMSK